MTSEPLGWGQLLRGEPGRGCDSWGGGLVGPRPCLCPGRLCRSLHSPRSDQGSDSHGQLSWGQGAAGEPTGC